MRAIYFLLSAGFLGSIVSAAEQTLPAKTALKALPPGAADRLAIVEGPEGSPEPARWHFLVQDPGAENGFREYVVAKSGVVANREISQFADHLSPEDIIGRGAFKLDSDKAAAIAMKYAAVNGKNVATLTYELRKNATDHKAVWTVRCVDPHGSTIGAVTLEAAKMAVLAHDGFERDPEEHRAIGTLRPGEQIAQAEPSANLPPIAEPPVTQTPNSESPITKTPGSEPLTPTRPPVSLRRGDSDEVWPNDRERYSRFEAPEEEPNYIPPRYEPEPRRSHSDRNRDSGRRSFSVKRFVRELLPF